MPVSIGVARFFSFRLDAGRARSYRKVMTNTNDITAQLLDAVLEAMTPGVETTVESVHDNVFLASAQPPLEVVLEALRRLNLDAAEGREVWVVGNGKRYLRPLVPGTGATYRIGSDRYAVTVIAVSPGGQKITTRDDRAIRTDNNGISELQDYRYERNPVGEIRTFYRDRNGQYGNKTRGGSLWLGVRHAYSDPSV